MLKIGRPILADAPPHCGYFFSLAKEDNLLDALEASKIITMDLMKSIPATNEDYSYAQGKWTIKTIFSHISDCERFYSYYSFCYSHKDHALMSDYDMDHYALNSKAGNRTIKDIGEEFLAVRESTIKLFSYMTDDMLDFKSNANPFVYTARSLGWMAAGHNLHHCNMIMKKYLV